MLRLQALGKDPNFNLFQQFGVSSCAELSVASGLLVTKRGTVTGLGRDLKRPFSIPYDTNAPFAPILTSDTPLDRWMDKHGFGAPPHPGGKISSSDTPLTGGATTMSLDEENTWHAEFTTIKGEAPASCLAWQERCDQHRFCRLQHRSLRPGQHCAGGADCIEPGP